MMKEIMNVRVIRIGSFGAVVFSLLSIPSAAAKTITQYQTMVQEKLIYITLSLVFFFVIYHKICSRISYDFSPTGEGGEKKDEKRDSTHSRDTSYINSSGERNSTITKDI